MVFHENFEFAKTTPSLKLEQFYFFYNLPAGAKGIPLGHAGLPDLQIGPLGTTIVIFMCYQFLIGFQM
jgi:hypothetical protein